MRAWLIRRLVAAWPLLLDELVVCVFLYPRVATVLRWPLLAVYAVLSWRLFRAVMGNRWAWRITFDHRTRIAHGLEHATLAVLRLGEVRPWHGFTHGPDRFVVAFAGERSAQRGHVIAAAAHALQRVERGESKLAYSPTCGTSWLISDIAAWLVYVTTAVLALGLGGSVPLFVGLGALLLRIWLAMRTGLGMLAQRLWTVSTDFTAGRLIDVREAPRVGRYVCPRGETWFEVTVAFDLAPSRGGLVAAAAPLA